MASRRGGDGGVNEEQSEEQVQKAEMEVRECHCCGGEGRVSKWVVEQSSRRNDDLLCSFIRLTCMSNETLCAHTRRGRVRECGTGTSAVDKRTTTLIVRYLYVRRF